ncbi:hypothetical protein EBZ35_03780 [bacterium]|nr:hypothetical protein [bacterium]
MGYNRLIGMVGMIGVGLWLAGLLGYTMASGSVSAGLLVLTTLTFILLAGVTVLGGAWLLSEWVWVRRRARHLLGIWGLLLIDAAKGLSTSRNIRSSSESGFDSRLAHCAVLFSHSDVESITYFIPRIKGADEIDERIPADHMVAIGSTIERLRAGGVDVRLLVSPSLQDDVSPQLSSFQMTTTSFPLPSAVFSSN